MLILHADLIRSFGCFLFPVSLVALDSYYIGYCEYPFPDLFFCGPVAQILGASAPPNSGFKRIKQFRYLKRYLYYMDGLSST